MIWPTNFSNTIFAQSNLYVDCPAQDTYFVGDFLIEDVTATIGSGGGMVNFESSSLFYGNLGKKVKQTARFIKEYF